MSSIHFEADLDSSKLEASVKQSGKTIKDWAKDVEKAGTQADQGLVKMTKSFKDAIKEQKQLVKDIESDVKNLQKAYDDATAGKGKQNAFKELRAAKKALAEEQGTLIGLQNEQIAVNNREADTSERIVGKLKAWGLGLISVGAAMKVVKSIIASTEATSKQFEIVIAEARSGVQYFFKSIASGDWSNFWEGLERSIKGAKEYVEALDVIANKQNEQKVKSSEYDLEIADLRDKTYNREKENNEERKSALTQIIKLERDKYTEEAALAKDIYETNLKKAATDSGLSEKQIENFIKEYSSLENLIALGEKYNALKKQLNPFEGLSKENLEIQGQIEKMGQAGKDAGEYVIQISKVLPETREMLSGYMAAANVAEAAFGSKNRRDKMQLAEVTKQIKEDIEAKSKAVLEIKNEIEVLKLESMDIGSQATEKGIKKELQLIDNKYEEDLVKFKDNEEAKNLLVEKYAIERLNIYKKYNTDVAESAIELDPGKGNSMLDRAINRPESGPNVIGGKNNTLTLAKMWQLRKSNNQVIKENKKDQKEINDDLTEENRLRNQITNEVANLVFELGKVSGMSDEGLRSLGNALDAFQRGISGDFIGAASSLLSGLMNMVPDQTEKFAVQMAKLNLLLSEQQRIVDSSGRFGGSQKALEDYIEVLKQQERLSFQAFGAKASIETQQAWIDAKNAIKDAEQTLEDFLSGNITENSIADVIAQGFSEGKTSVDDFAGYMNDVLLEAVLNVFKSEILGPQINDITKYIKNALSDKILTSEEKADIDRMTKEAADANKQVWDNLTNGLDLGNGPQPGLSGAISRQITEDTGTELAGLFRRFADDERAVKDYSIMGVNHLVAIEANTAATVEQLKTAVIELKAINSNTKTAYAGEL